jgi:hypothetical protein
VDERFDGIERKGIFMGPDMRKKWVQY